MNQLEKTRNEFVGRIMTINVNDWYYTLRTVICRNEFTVPLREAAMAGRLGEWTSILTHAVVQTCSSYGWVASAREHSGESLPVSRQEYLGLDVIAFESSSPETASRWRLPIAVFELENRDNLDIISYSIWKVIVVRCALRGVFCYCRKPNEVQRLVATLGQTVVNGLEINHTNVVPLLLVVGTRSKAGLFPDGFFQPYYWDTQRSRFRGLL